MLGLVVWLMTAANPPAPMPPGCRIELAATGIVVKSGGKEARHTFGEGEHTTAPGTGGPKLTTLPHRGAKERVFVALREPWEGVAPAGLGHLYEVTCGRDPAIAIALVAPGLDLGRVAVARDGRWIVGGWGGLRVLDPIARRLTPLTAPPSYPAPRCWSAEEGKPAPAADVPLVDEASGVAAARADGAEEIAFLRGGACGREAALTMTRHTLALDRGTVRPQKSVVAFALVDDGPLGHLLLGDGEGPCEAQTPGALIVSRDGGATWEPSQILKGGPGVARLARAPDGRWLALTGICETGGGGAGGDLFASADLVAWERLEVVPAGTSSEVERGAGLRELVVDAQRVHVAVKEGERTAWWSSRDGQTWERGARRQAPRPDPALARTLGVERVHGTVVSLGGTFAWTSDGLFRQADTRAPWVRVWP